MTTTKSKPLATAKEKTKPPKPNDHGLSYKKLIQIHRDTRESGWSWGSAATIKDNYQIPGSVLASFHSIYGLPQLVSSRNQMPVYSLPCLEVILETIESLHETSTEDSTKERMQILQAEAEEEVKDAMRAELENKFQTV